MKSKLATRAPDFVGLESELSLLQNGDNAGHQLVYHDGETEGGLMVSEGVILDMPHKVKVSNNIQGVIANFDSFTEYDVSVNAGAVTLTGDTLTFDAPSDTSINPVNLSITADGINYSFSVELEGSGLGLDVVYTQLTSGATGRNNLAAVAIEGRMYVFGGYDGSNYLNDLWEYDPSTDTWQQLSNGATARYFHTAVVIDNKMYVFGGYGLDANGNSNRLNDLWEYDPSTDTWQQLSSGATVRSGHSAVAISGKMYVFGGNDGDRLNDLWEYDPSTGTWQQLSSGATARNTHAAVAIDGKMYIFGGYDSDRNRPNDLWEYDPSTDVWQQLSNGATARNRHSAVAINDKMYVFGGWDSNSNRLNDLWEYDPSTDVWQQLSSGATVRYYHAAAAIGGKMYVFGGRDSNNNRLNDLWVIE